LENVLAMSSSKNGKGISVLNSTKDSKKEGEGKKSQYLQSKVRPAM
jgi:hypothetical protein